ADQSTTVGVYALVTNPDGTPVATGTVVEWSLENALVSLLFDFTNVQTVTFNNEAVTADSFTQLTVRFPVAELVGVWAAADTQRLTNLAAAGYSIQERRITLDDELFYCDQSVVVAYRAEGVAANQVVAGEFSGNVYVYASVGGQREGIEFFVDNPCECPVLLVVQPVPSSILQGADSRVIIAGEESGGPIATGRLAYLAEPTKLGSLSWKIGRFDTISLSNEPTQAVNEVAGITETVTKFFILSVSGV
ncbi:unnamed protein product, partial [marine sediment metagenome]